jgi:xylulokinase
MMRAAFEGVAFALRAGLDAIGADAGQGRGKEGAKIDRLRLAGGGSVDPRWRQLLADALDAELDAVDCPNVGARGAGLIAGLASGHWREADLPALAPPAEPVGSPSGDAALAARYARFLDLYGRTESWFGVAQR